MLSSRARLARRVRGASKGMKVATGRRTAGVAGRRGRRAEGDPFWERVVPTDAARHSLSRRQATLAQGNRWRRDRPRHQRSDRPARRRQRLSSCRWLNRPRSNLPRPLNRRPRQSRRAQRRSPLSERHRRRDRRRRRALAHSPPWHRDRHARFIRASSRRRPDRMRGGRITRGLSIDPFAEAATRETKQ